MMYTALCILAFLMLLVGCKSTPDGVLSHDDFVDLLVDLHKGEAYTDIFFREFREDSMKATYQQSLLKKHGITQEEFDTTMVWYGAHIEDYISVYDDVIAQLEKESSQITATANQALSLIGDSVNLWHESSHYVINRRSPSQFLQFYVEYDENWENGDSYTWQFKTFNNVSSAIMAMVVEYKDFSTEYRTDDVKEDGWKKMTMVIDSLKTPVALYGYVKFDVREDEEVYIDSMSLIRNRFTELEYRRRFNQKRFEYGIDQIQRNKIRAEESREAVNTFKEVIKNRKD